MMKAAKTLWFFLLYFTTLGGKKYLTTKNTQIFHEEPQRISNNAERHPFGSNAQFLKLLKLCDYLCCTLWFLVVRNI